MKINIFLSIIDKNILAFGGPVVWLGVWLGGLPKGLLKVYLKKRIYVGKI